MISFGSSANVARFAIVFLLFGCAAAIGFDKSSRVESDLLGGSERYLAYLGTDKPIYRSGETVYFRAVVLNALDNTPVTENRLDIQLKIQGPRGEVVFESYGLGDDSTVGQSWEVPDGLSGGQYTAKVTSPSLGFPETERKFDIRSYRPPRIKSQIEFQRDGYGAGDTVHASVSLERAEGGIPLDASVTAVARVDGKEIFSQSDLKLLDDGTLSVSLDLPAAIDVGMGTLSFIVEDGGQVETASKTIPIVLQNIDLTFYPEGGDLINGLESRVYFQANLPTGKPADISGRIVRLNKDLTIADSVAQANTQHEGRGSFSFTAEDNAIYALVVDKPSGITRHFRLPESKTAGAVIRSSKPVYEYDEPLSVMVESKGRLADSLTLQKREKILDTKAVVSETIVLDAGDSEGVLVVTVWDAKGQPLAERLIYRKPKFALNIDLSIKDQNYVPGGSVSVDIQTTDANGQPVEAIVGLTVTDDAVLEIMDKRDQAPRLPVMVFLENEVMDLADASVYLDADDPEAPAAVDLILGTQGWRRFILYNYDQIENVHPEAARRVMATRQSPPVMMLRKNRQVLEAPMAVMQMDDQAQAVPPVELEDLDVPIALNEQAEEVLIPEPFNEVNAGQELGNIAIEEKDIVAAKPALEARREAMPRVVVREFSFQVRANRKPNDRIDFTETLYWHKGIKTSARDGKATIEFDLSDSVTTFRVMADGFGRNGAIGSADTVVSSVEPFYIEPLLPLEATVGDTISMPVTMVNASSDVLNSVKLVVKADGLEMTQPSSIKLAAGERRRQIITISPKKPGSFSIVVNSAAGAYTDTVTRTLVVKPGGFPVNVHHGGLLAPTSGFSVQLDIPQKIEPGSLTGVAKVYPSPLANMEEALNALLQQPNGCFEQTSSSNYPLVMAQQYFMTHQGISPEKISRARELLDDGYTKLVGFEASDKGYEWFGASPAHEALTAYGLMEFVDMSKVMSVDTQMISRTRNWLLDRRDGKGGFKRNEKALDSFGGAPAPTTNTYIVWALLESGEKPTSLVDEIAAAKAHALETDDLYTIALTANILYLAGDSEGASIISRKLVDAVDTDGAVRGALTSITRSGGDSLVIETTSLALLAWLKDDAQWAAQVENSMKWLFERSKSGQFGSTQSTILALKAINAYDVARAVPKVAGAVQLMIDGKPFGHAVSFDPESKGAIELPDFSAALSSGEHTVALKMTDGSKMPFSVEVSYNTPLPASSNEAEIGLETELSANSVIEGETLEVNVTVTAGKNDAPTPIAIIGIPAGLEVRHDQLKELVGSGLISSYEVNGRNLVLYWRELKADDTRMIPVSVTAKVPGSYTGPASRAYLYYTDEHKQWATGQVVSISAR